MHKQKRITHVFYSGLGGHTAVFWAQQKYSEGERFVINVCLYGIEQPLDETIKNCTAKNIKLQFDLKKGKWDFFHDFRLARSIFRTKPDIVFLHGTYAVFPIVLFSLFSKSKLVIRETHAITLKNFRGKINSLLGLIGSDHMVFLSESYRNAYISGWKNFFTEKTSIIPNGLDLDLFYPASVNDENGIIRIGMQSRLVPIKDHKTLIYAIADLVQKFENKFELLIAGDGTTRPELEKLVQELNLSNHVKFLGMLPQDELAKYLQELDIYVHSSMGETMSNSIMQAQSAGLPIIGTDVFGINNVISNGENGFLFTLGNKDELVEILYNLISNMELRKKFGHISRAYAEENLSDKVMAHKYYNLFNKL